MNANHFNHYNFCDRNPSTLLFALAHVPLWGWGAASTTLFSDAILTGFYIWQQDLIANIIAHILTDTVGIVLSKRE